MLDSWALLAYFEDQPAAPKVTQILQSAASEGRNLLFSVVNWGEVVYIVENRYGKERRDEIEHLMDQMPLEIINADRELTRLAAHFKASEKLSYGDCFAAALAFDRHAMLVTGDREFEQLKNKIRIEWL